MRFRQRTLSSLCTVVHMRRRTRLAAVAAAACLLSAAPASAADWADVDPFAICPTAAPNCLDVTLTEMRERLAGHDRTCNHNGLFLRNYINVTEAYAKSLREEPELFDDPDWLAREDAIFAAQYFQAEDRWKAGRLSEVPKAWRIAFGAADRGRVQGIGNLLLGINAHVQQDMAFMVEAAGIRAPDGASRRRDHDIFMKVLARQYDRILADAIAYDDPDMRVFQFPNNFDKQVAVTLVDAWRDLVWANAVALTGARTAPARARIVRRIELNAVAWANTFVETFKYRTGITSPARRNALCAARNAT